MKTAISVPDKLFKHADSYAKKLGISRSYLFSRALEEYFENHHPDDVTEKLDHLYDQEDSKLDSAFVKLQAQAIKTEDW